MSLRSKIIVLSAWLLVAVIVLIAAWTAVEKLPTDAAGEVGAARNWLAVIVALFVANYALAWHHRVSWTVTLIRSLAWAFIAYICISDAVDAFGEQRELAWQILGRDGPGDPALITAQRWRLVLRAVGLVSAAICVGVGFEKYSGERTSSK